MLRSYQVILEWQSDGLHIQTTGIGQVNPQGCPSTSEESGSSEDSVTIDIFLEFLALCG